MHIDLFTLALQIINFLLLVWLLRRFFYQPVLTFIARRQKTIDTALEQAAAKQAAAENERKAYEEKLASATEERQQLISKARTDLAEERTRILEQARLDAKDVLDRGHQKLDHDRKALSLQLVEESCALATAVSAKLLEDVAGSGVDELFFQRLDAYLGELPADRIASLRRNLEADSVVEIATASPMEVDRQDYWRQRLAAWLPDISTRTFLTDPALIAGIEIRFPSGIIAFTWRRSLEAAKQTLLSHETAA